MVIATGLAGYTGRALVETRSWRWIYYIYIALVGEYIRLSQCEVGT